MFPHLWSIRCVSAVAISGLLAIPSPQTYGVAGHGVAGRYVIIELPLRPKHLNNSGQVIGMTAKHRAAVWTRQSGLQEIAIPSEFTSAQVTSLNSAGDLAGFANGGDHHRAFIYRNGKFLLLPGKQSKPFAIDDFGEAVGESMLPGRTTTEPVLWQGQSVVDLGACCGGTAKSINKQGQIVGDVYDKSGRYHAFLWSKSIGMRLIDPWRKFSSAIALNDAGHILVQAVTEGVFLSVEGTLIPVEIPPSNASSPRAINNGDVIVGAYGPYEDAERAFAWDRVQGFVDLNDRVGADSGWNLEVASDVNDRGEIVGWGDHGTDDAGFMLVPKW